MIRGELLTSALGDPEYVSAMERAADAFLRYRAHLPAIPYAYTRTRVLEKPHFEIVAMQWAAGSVSPIHDHGESRCWVLMLEGSLYVENFDREDDGSGEVSIRQSGTLHINAGELDFRGSPRELHRVVNSSSETAYSLQLYALPISTYNVFEEHTNVSRAVSATCDLLLDLDTLSP
jgi:predicted metal-dependent enzyme (double-stranded beta helix superfamily)